MKIHTKHIEAIMDGEKVSRKIKKSFFGKRMGKSKLKKLLSRVEIIKESKTMYESSIIKPYMFCPFCGCVHMQGTGNLTEYPEHWEYFHCLKCRKRVAFIDNSPFVHALELKDEDYIID